MGPPPVLPGLHAGENPVDRALTLWLAGETETALRWAGAALLAEPELPSGLYLVAELLAVLGRKDPAREGLEACVTRSIDAGLLPLAVAAANSLRKISGDANKSYAAIADAFHAGSSRLDDDTRVPPPPPPKQAEVQPMSSLLMGAALLNKATDILRQAIAVLKTALATSPTPLVPRLAVFSQLSREGLAGLCEAFETRLAPAGIEVIREGEPGTEAFLVVRGELDVRRASKSETGEASAVLARLQSGQIFGEMALVSRAPRAASVIATRPSLLLAAPVSRLEAVALQSPDVGELLASFCRGRMMQNLVRSSPLLRTVPSKDRAELVERFVSRTFEPGQPLIQRGEIGHGLFLIASGRVEISSTEGGERLVISTLSAGDILGEVATILRRPAGADVVALAPTVTLHLPAALLPQLLRAHPALLAELYDLAVRRDEENSLVIAQEATDADDYILV